MVGLESVKNLLKIDYKIHKNQNFSQIHIQQHTNLNLNQTKRMKTLTTIFVMILATTFVGCGNATTEEKVPTTDSTTVDSVKVDTTVTLPVDTLKK